LGFLHRSSLENKLQEIYARSWAQMVHEALETLTREIMAHGHAVMAPGAAPELRILAFFNRSSVWKLQGI
jgi:hypothetical protein